MSKSELKAGFVWRGSVEHDQLVAALLATRLDLEVLQQRLRESSIGGDLPMDQGGIDDAFDKMKGWAAAAFPGITVTKAEP